MEDMNAWFDSHAHVQWLDDPDAALAAARVAGVVGFVCVGTDLETSRQALDLAARHHDVSAAVGIHPHEASKLRAEWGHLEALAHSDDVVAIGETGLDYHYLHAPPDEQEAAFRWHIRLAHRLALTLVIHSRDAWTDTFRVLEDEGVPERTVFHCFTGGEREAMRALDLGTTLSFSGIVSFPDAHDVRAAALVTPLDRVLVETDTPYLAPVPRRGRPNEPANVAFVGAALAAAMQRDLREIANATTRNARCLMASR